ncbi:MAG: hypothetical protein HUU29_07260 [Planctomycetaceae bacterium]|nr:hypothetical protein [Planctomycetaceae bacterium]
MKYVFRSLFAFAVLAASSIFAPGIVGATVVKQFALKELVDTATKAIHVKVTKAEAAYDADKKRIWTTYTLTVLDTLKGENAETLEVRVRGGAVGNRAQHVAGAAHMEAGKEYVLFVGIDNEQKNQVVGMSQGRFSVAREEGKIATVANSLKDMRVADKQGNVKAPDKENPISNTLDDFKREVRKLAGTLPKDEEKKDGAASKAAKADTATSNGKESE